LRGTTFLIEAPRAQRGAKEEKREEIENYFFFALPFALLGALGAFV
jgi:hypothetical protein